MPGLVNIQKLIVFQWNFTNVFKTILILFGHTDDLKALESTQFKKMNPSDIIEQQ